MAIGYKHSMTLENIEILFEDSWLLVVNKPSGLPTQPTPDPKRPSLYTLLLESKKWPYLGLHHRLDAPTSGIVLLTKKKEANKGVSELFQGRGVQKNYLCLCHGHPTAESFEIQNHLKAIKMKSGKSKMIATASGGDFAHTKFKLLERLNKNSFIQASPLTGRMHQIRTHLAELKIPIEGDSLYFRTDRHFPRLLLHAAELQFDHPITQKTMTIKAPLPPDFLRVLEKLRSAPL